MAEWFATLCCRVMGHQWIARQYHDDRTHDFRVCQRCSQVDEVAEHPMSHRRARHRPPVRLRRRLG
jgi:hypothetical protein